MREKRRTPPAAPDRHACFHCALGPIVQARLTASLDSPDTIIAGMLSVIGDMMTQFDATERNYWLKRLELHVAMRIRDNDAQQLGQARARPGSARSGGVQ